jgi:hypothetical protein
LCLFVLLTGLLGASRLAAQNASGSIVGHVKDPQGAAVVGAQVSVTNVDTHDFRTVSTNGEGDYTIPVLQPGHYEVDVAGKGFKSERQSGIVLDVDQTVRVETTLTIGSSTETISVNATALTLDTDTAAVEQTITGQQIAALPLNGRNFQDLMLLAPGAVNNPGGEQTQYRIQITGTNLSSVSLGGSRGSSEGYTMDGTSILDFGYDDPMYEPSLDDVAEFDLLTKSYSAAYGYSMNQINITSKSGTNSYHGSAFEFLRNNFADAFPHGANYQLAAGQAVPFSLLQQNQFGYSLGGPVRVPWLYNGKNKTFFFANYEGYRQNVGGSSLAGVPNADEMKGIIDASVLGTFTAAQAPAGVGYTQCGVTYQAGQQHPLFAPFNYPSLGITAGCPLTTFSTSSSYTIPTSLISDLGKVILTPGIYFPAAPNVTGAAVSTNNYSFSSASTLKYDQQNYRVDQNIGSRDSIFFHITWHNENEASGAVTPANETVTTQPARLYTLTETHVFSPNLTNQVRVGYSQQKWIQGPALAISPAAVSALNWPSPFLTAGDGYPRIEYDSNSLNDGYVYNGGGAFVSSTTTEVPSNWDYSESVIWTIKRHTLSIGFGGYRRIYATITSGGLGRINYNGEYSGDDFADSLLGASPQLAITELGPTSNATSGLANHLVYHNYAPYVQDDWKVNDKLTLNLGLRYEFIATPYEEQNEFTWPDFSAPGGALYIANAQTAKQYGGVNPLDPSTGLYVPSPGGERGPGPAPKDDFAPRLGFAYRVFGDDKTVLRGGFGKYYDSIEDNELDQGNVNPFPSASGFGNGTDAPQSYPALFNTNSMPLASATGQLTTGNLGFGVWQGDHYKNPYYLAWNLGVERELPGANRLEVDYIGNHGTNLFGRSNPNAPSQCIPQNGCIASSGGPSVPVASRVPYANMGTLVNAIFDDFANYNAGDVKLEHRARDLDLVVAYTWSKALDTKSSVAGLSGGGVSDNAGWAGPQDGHNIASDYARGGYDVGNRLAFTAVYALPIGTGKAILGNAPKLADEVIGGWKYGIISSVQGGIPFTIVGADNGNNNTDSERANFNPGAPKCPKSHQQWFCSDDVAGSTDKTFTQPNWGYFGNSSRDVIRGPGLFLADMSLSKSFSIVEKSAFELRFDAFNALNHWNPGQPDDTMDNTSLQPNGYPTVANILPNNQQGSSRILQLSGRFTF